MSDDILLYDLSDGILTLTLNRPKSRNALNPPLMRALLDTLADAAEDARVRCLVLRGAGGNFCAGGDIAAAKDANETKQQSAEELAAAAERAAKRGPISPDLMTKWLRRNSEVTKLLHTMPKPTVAALQGNVVGAGIGLALACDFRVVAASAKLTSSFVNVGYSGDFGASYFLTKTIGAAKAKEVLMLNRRLTSDDMNRLGLATDLVADEELDQVTRALALGLAKAPPIALAYMKQNIGTALDNDLDLCLDLEAINQNRAGATEDSREAIKAFFDKRQPVFQGK